MKKLFCFVLAAAMIMSMVTVSYAAQKKSSELNISGDGDWLIADKRADNTADYIISYDLHFAKISTASANDSWQDDSWFVIRNGATDNYEKIQIQTYRNAGGFFQIYCSTQAWNGSSWSQDRPDKWSPNFESPVNDVNVTVSYDAAQAVFTWVLTDKTSGAVVNQGSTKAGMLTDSIKTCTDSEIKFYRNDNSTTFSNAKYFCSESADMDADGDGWVKANKTLNNKKDYVLSFDAHLANILSCTDADKWADAVKLVIRNAAEDDYIYFRIQSYSKGGGKYQIYCSTQVYNGNWSDGADAWSEQYDAPVSDVKVVLTYNASKGAYSWAIIDRASGKGVNAGTAPEAAMVDTVKNCEACEVRANLEEAGDTVSNVKFAYKEIVKEEPGKLPEGATAITFTPSSGGWNETSVKADNTQKYIIGYDVEFGKIGSGVNPNTWADSAEFIIRNESSDNYIKFQLQSYRNGGGKYQIAGSSQVWNGSGWSDRPFIWSQNLDTPATGVHMEITYNGDGTYSWETTDAAGITVNTGATTAAMMTDSLKNCTACQLRMYFDNSESQIKNAYILPVEETEVETTVSGAVGETFSLNVNAELKGEYKNYKSAKAYAVIGDGKAEELPGTCTDNVWSFELSNIPMTKLASKISIKIYGVDDKQAETEIKSVENYSVKDYCDALYEQNKTDETLIGFIANMLEFGAKLQQFENAGSENLPNTSAWVAENIGNEAPVADVEVISTAMPEDSFINAAGLRVKDKISIYYNAFSAVDEGAVLTVKAEGKDDQVFNLKKGVNSIVIDKINPNEYDTVFTAELSVGGEKVQTVYYSVNTYTARMAARSEIAATVKAIYNFGLAAEDYLVK